MPTTKKADRATAVPTERLVTRQEKIEGGRAQIGAIQKGADYGQATDVKAKTDEWSAVIDGWENNGRQIAALTLQLDALKANEPVFARRWDTKRRAVFSAVTDYADGSIDKVHGFGCAVLGHEPLPPAGVPTNLRDKHSKVHGAAIAEWDTMNGNLGFMVQHAADPSSPATYAEPVVTSKSTFKLPGQVRGATIYFRVLALDPKVPGGKTDWTPWVPVVVG
ncbi:MAG: hypothetical protein QM820_18275 [Minicystis sp.]